MSKNNKTYSFIINNALKLLLLIGLFFVLYHQLFKHQNFTGFKEEFMLNWRQGNAVLMVVVLCLMPINWWLESIKWKRLLKPFINISSSISIKGVLSGVTLAVITPARIGEYGGRIAVLPSDNNWHGLVATLVSSISQNLSNVIFGFIGAVGFVALYIEVPRFAIWGLISSGTFVLLFAILIYFNIAGFKRLLKNVLPNKVLIRFKKQLNMLAAYDENTLKSAFKISVLRYVIYLSQYVLILKAFGIGIPVIASVSGVAMIFLIQSGIPLPPVLGIMARGELAVVVWSVFSSNLLGIFAATFALWIINLIIPALLGLMIVLNVNILRSFGYERK